MSYVYVFILLNSNPIYIKHNELAFSQFVLLVKICIYVETYYTSILKLLLKSVQLKCMQFLMNLIKPDTVFLLRNDET